MQEGGFILLGYLSPSKLHFTRGQVLFLHVAAQASCLCQREFRVLCADHSLLPGRAVLHGPPTSHLYLSSLPMIFCCSFSYCHILVLSPFFGVVQLNQVSADLSQPGIGFNSLLRSCLSSGFSLVFQDACLALGWEGRGRAPEVGGSAALQVCADRHPPPPGSKADGPPAE